MLNSRFVDNADDLTARPIRRRFVERLRALRPAILKAMDEAIFGFPLTVGTLRIGALDLYSTALGHSALRSFPTHSTWPTS